MEKELYEELRKIGFTPVVIPITRFQKFINIFHKGRYVPKLRIFHVEKVINSVKWEFVHDENGKNVIYIGGDLMPQNLSELTVDEILTLIPTEDEVQ